MQMLMLMGQRSIIPAIEGLLKYWIAQAFHTGSALLTPSFDRVVYCCSGTCVNPPDDLKSTKWEVKNLHFTIALQFRFISAAPRIHPHVDHFLSGHQLWSPGSMLLGPSTTDHYLDNLHHVLKWLNSCPRNLKRQFLLALALVWNHICILLRSTWSESGRENLPTVICEYFWTQVAGHVLCVCKLTWLCWAALCKGRKIDQHLGSLTPLLPLSFLLCSLPLLLDPFLIHFIFLSPCDIDR